MLLSGDDAPSAVRVRDRRARLEAPGSELVFPVRRLAPDGLEARAQVIERAWSTRSFGWR
jgi:hypothetical protein